LYQRIGAYLDAKKLEGIDKSSFADDLIDFIKKDQINNNSAQDFSYFSDDEINSIKLLLNQSSANTFNYLNHTKESLQKTSRSNGGRKRIRPRDRRCRCS
jgi:hypothetical protein